MVTIDAELKKVQLSFQETNNYNSLLRDFFSLKKELRKSKKDYQHFYDYNTAIYFTLDHNYIIKALNFQAAHFLGSDRKKIINNPFLDYLTTNSHRSFKNSILNLFNKKLKQVCNIEILTKDHHKKLVILESTLLENNLIRVCLLDITDNQHNVDKILELENSLNLINNLFQQSNEAIAALDSELKIITMNQLFIQFFSNIFSTQLRTGENLVSLISNFPKIKIELIAACKKAIENKKSSIIIENRDSLNETYYCYELKIRCLYNEYSKRNELIIQIINITEYKIQAIRQHKQQADLALSSRTRVMGEMASALAHEINQPLTAINTYSHSCLFLINNAQNYEEICKTLIEPLEKIASQAEHAGEIIHSMKKFMKEGKLNFEKTDINLLVNETLSILYYELNSKLLIKLNLKNLLPMVMVNKIHIMQVILNLVRNSIEALQTITHESPEVVIETNETVNHIIISVRDNGPGIPEKYKNKILNTYFTTKPQGTGIGLGICRTLIQEHGGWLHVSQLEEGGACFSFTLPKHHV